MTQIKPRLLTEEILTEIALQFKTRQEFKQKDFSAYSSAVKKKILDKICSHMPPTKPKAIDELLNNEILLWCLKINYISELKKLEPKLYAEIIKRNIFDECTAHMQNERIIKFGKKYKFNEFKSVAENYTELKDFKKYENSMYMVGYRNGWLNKVNLNKKEINSWDFESIKIIAEKYLTRTEFYLNDKDAYEAAIRFNIIDIVCSHMLNNIQEKWDFNKVYNLALECNTRSEFMFKYPNAYCAAKRLNIFSEITLHMKEYNYIQWTIEKCHELAITCNSRSEFAELYPNAYDAACKRLKCIDFICSHMYDDRLNYDRVIYAYIFEETKTVYIGLTLNLASRKKQRLKNNNDSVTIYISETNLKPKIILLTEYLPAKTAQIMEQFYIDKYKNEQWNILNKVSGGSLGGGYRKSKQTTIQN